ncbi:uncharacterized protein LOC143149045 [Ptiloglossa arizonensis]|uniref:uncharacterized protein LOC143149045 n=1 Tax=Ptiloglossa arizonensis TaxID=3350558 RepID=UPI003F9EC0DE
MRFLNVRRVNIETKSGCRGVNKRSQLRPESPFVRSLTQTSYVTWSMEHVIKFHGFARSFFVTHAEVLVLPVVGILPGILTADLNVKHAAAGIPGSLCRVIFGRLLRFSSTIPVQDSRASEYTQPTGFVPSE